MKSALRAFKNEWNDYCEGERIVRELTSNDDEKPQQEMLQRLAYLISAEPENYQKTYMMIMRRVTDYKYLRHTEKGLITVEYLLKYADQRFARSCKVHARHFQKLKGYTYDLYGRDYGANVRRRATRIATMLENDDELEAARAEAQGRSIPEKKKKSTTSAEISSTKKEEKDNNKTGENIKPSAAKKKSKSKEDQDQKKKETKKPKEQLAPTEDLLGDVFYSAPKTTQVNASSEDWLEEFAVENEDGVAEDGGKFGFADFEEDNDFFDGNENKNEIQTEDSVNKTDEWMTKLTQMDDPLQEMEKPQQKVNKKRENDGPNAVKRKRLGRYI